MNFSDTKLNFYEALRVCQRNSYYSANSHLIHRNELIHLHTNRLNHSRGIDFVQVYAKLNKINNKKKIKRQPKVNNSGSNNILTTSVGEFSIWLDDNLYADFACQSKEQAPFVRFNAQKCLEGCFGCDSRTKAQHYYVCVKGVDYKVPLDSFCNTNNLTQYEIKNNNNLYYQSGEQIYLCQGQLKCVDFACKCPVVNKQGKQAC